VREGWLRLLLANIECVHELTSGSPRISILYNTVLDLDTVQGEDAIFFVVSSEDCPSSSA
jgi:hypothetical protein